MVSSRQYSRATLDLADVASSPFEQFQRWFADAEAVESRDVHAMTLATVDASGRPDARVVLLKGVDERGFAFFTDLRSIKAQELAATPAGALVFWWPELERQVRVRGPVTPASRAEAEEYFASRPRGSQLGSWSSTQSSVLPDRQSLERELEQVTARMGTSPVPTPPHWCGFRIAPDEIEFWQGRQDRLHDRLRYRRAGTEWLIERLSP